MSLAFSQHNPRNQRLAIVDSNRQVWLWSLARNRLSSFHEELQASSQDVNIYSVAFNPERDQLATVGDDDIIELWDINSGKNSIVLIQDKKLSIASRFEMGRIWQRAG
ncbi:MAG: hypothetical protein HC772_10585 [Leptolyngbyaceae cyanobacterium CRU_2_3]|nr:hypothetical protein [Leptolyngbyaceae cyanobacterium CRU_2_3]